MYSVPGEEDGIIRLQQPLQNRIHDTAISMFQARSTMGDGQKRDTPVVPNGQGKITPVKYSVIPLTAGLRCPLPERADSRELVLISSR